MVFFVGETQIVTKWLAWAKYCYNTCMHSATGTSPFEVVYGRPPPTIRDFLLGEVRALAVVENLWFRDEVLAQLSLHLERPQQRMTIAANKHRRDVDYEVGDLVYLKFRPYRQSTLFSANNRKLAQHYFGPFRVEGRIGRTAYRLELPVGSRVHPVLYVSLLKRPMGTAEVDPTLPESLLEAEPLFLPEKILDSGRSPRKGIR